MERFKAIERYKNMRLCWLRRTSTVVFAVMDGLKKIMVEIVRSEKSTGTNPQSIKDSFQKNSLTAVTMTVIMTVTMTVIMTVMCININESPLVSFSSVKRMMKRIGTPRVSNQDVGSNMRGTSWMSGYRDCVTFQLRHSAEMTGFHTCGFTVHSR